MTSGVYAILCRASGRQYTGSSADIQKRWRQHKSMLRRGKHHSPPLQNAWNKYGEDAFEFVVLEECAVNLLLELEQHYIDQCCDGYNCAPVAGTRRGVPQSPEARAKISAAMTGRKLSVETRAKMGAAKRGHKYSVGRVVSPETRAKIGAANRKPKPSLLGNRNAVGNSPSPEAREKMGAPHRGVPKSEDTKRRMRAAALARQSND